MTTNDSSNPCPLELVEILKRLGKHRRAVYEQTYGKPRWTREQSDAYFYHPLVRACEWLEERLGGITRYELEHAAFRLTTPLGLKGMDAFPNPDGSEGDPEIPDWLWMTAKFRKLDRDGTTARLWRWLAKEYPVILEEAGIQVESQPPTPKPRHVYHDKPQESTHKGPAVIRHETPDRIEEHVCSTPRLISRHSIGPDGEAVHEHFPDPEPTGNEISTAAIVAHIAKMIQDAGAAGKIPDEQPQDDDHGQDAGAGTKGSPDYQELVKWAADNLKGKQRRAVELLAERGGRIEIADLATDPAIDWQPPFDNAFNGIAKALKPKLDNRGWRMFRQANEARLEQTGRGQK